MKGEIKNPKGYPKGRPNNQTVFTFLESFPLLEDARAELLKEYPNMPEEQLTRVNYIMNKYHQHLRSGDKQILIDWLDRKMGRAVQPTREENPANTQVMIQINEIASAKHTDMRVDNG